MAEESTVVETSSEFDFDAAFDETFASEEPVADEASEEPANDSSEEPGEVESPEDPAADESTEETSGEEAETTEQPTEEGEEVVLRGAVNRKIDGKPALVLNSDRARELAAVEQRVSEVADVLGDDSFTVESVRTIATEANTYQAIKADFISGDLGAHGDGHGNIAAYFSNLARGAVESGKASDDPYGGLLSKMIDVAAKNHPEAIKAIGEGFRGTIIEDLYRLAGGDEIRIKAAMHAEKMLTGKFRTMEEAKTGRRHTPVPTEREIELDRRERELAEGRQRETRAAWDGWMKSDQTALVSAVNSGIDEQLKPFADRFKDNPQAKQNIIARLKSEIQESFAKDPAWKDGNVNLRRQAQVASRADVRQSLAEDLQRRYTAKVKRVLAKIAPEVVSGETRRVASAGAAKSQKLQQVQNMRKTPSGSAPAPRLPERPSGGGGVLVDVGDAGDLFDKIFSS